MRAFSRLLFSVLIFAQCVGSFVQLIAWKIPTKICYTSLFISYNNRIHPMKSTNFASLFIFDHNNKKKKLIARSYQDLKKGNIKSILFVRILFCLINPTSSLSFNPFAYFFIPILNIILSYPVLLPILPISWVFTTIRPIKSSFPMFFVIFIKTFILPSISPLNFPITMHFIVLPVSFIFPIFTPHIFTFPMNLIVQKIPIIVTTI